MQVLTSFIRSIYRNAALALLLIIFVTSTTAIEAQVIEIEMLDTVPVNGTSNGFFLPGDNILFNNNYPIDICILIKNSLVFQNGKFIPCENLENFSLHTKSTEFNIVKSKTSNGFYVSYKYFCKPLQQSVSIYATWMSNGLEYSTNDFIFIQYNKEFPICGPPSISIEHKKLFFKVQCINNGGKAKRAFVLMQDINGNYLYTKNVSNIITSKDSTEMQYTFSITIDSLKSPGLIHLCNFDFSNDYQAVNNYSGSVNLIFYVIKGDTAIILNKNIYTFHNKSFYENKDSISLVNIPIRFLESAKIENDSLIFCFAKMNEQNKFNYDSLKAYNNYLKNIMTFNGTYINSTPVNKTQGVIFKVPSSIFTRDSIYRFFCVSNELRSPDYSFIIHNEELIVFDNNYKNPSYIGNNFSNERIYQLKLPNKFLFSQEIPAAIQRPVVAEETLDTIFLTKEQCRIIDRDINRQLNIKLQRIRNRNGYNQLKNCFNTIEKSPYLDKRKKTALKQDVEEIRIYTGKLKRNKILNAAEIMISNDYLFEYIRILKQIAAGKDSTGIDLYYNYLRDFLFSKFKFYYPGSISSGIIWDSIPGKGAPSYGMGNYKKENIIVAITKDVDKQNFPRMPKLLLRAYTLNQYGKKKYDETLRTVFFLDKYNGYPGKYYHGTTSSIDGVFYYVITAIAENEKHTYYFINSINNNKVSDENSCIIYGTIYNVQKNEVYITK